MPEILLLGLFAHLVGDYLLQSTRMALGKTQRWTPAVAHALCYGLPFLALTRFPAALAVVVGTHAVIDRYRLARHACWARNQIAPRAFRPAPTDITRNGGFAATVPAGMAAAQVILTDNTLHLLINSAALTWLR
jgi:hypothetical protein